MQRDDVEESLSIFFYLTNTLPALNTRIEILKRYLEEDPSDSFLRYALALEFIGLNDNDEAFSRLQELLNEEPDYLAAYYMAGKAAEAIGKKSSAVEFYSRGIEVARHQNDLHTMNELKAALDLLE